MVETELLARAARTPPSEANLVAYVEALLLVPCPDTVVVPGHDTPGSHLRAMWRGDASTVTIASRGAYKTLATAAAEFLLALHRGVRILHFAQYESQADQAWRYIAGFGGLPWFEGLVSVTRSEIAFPMSRGSIEFRALTVGNARSAHVPVVVYDEADEMEPEILQIARFTTGAVGGEQARVHYVSSQNYPDGIVDRLVRLAPARGIGVYRWNYKEAAEHCPDERSGTRPVTAWVDERRMLRDTSRPSDGGSWRPVEVFDGCLECPLLPSCRGDLKRAAGSVPIRLILDLRNDPAFAPHVWRSQMDNEAPSLEGLAVPEFDASLSVTDAAEYDRDLPWLLGVDFGHGHPAAVVAAQPVPVGHKGNRVLGRKHVFAEYTAHAPFLPRITDWITANWVPKYGHPDRAWVDPSGAPVAELVPLGTRTLRLEKARSNKHKVGYDALRGHCTPTQEDGKPKLLIHPRCARLVHEFRTVRRALNRDGTYAEEIVKVGDDVLDACRYFVVSAAESRWFTPEELRAMEREWHRGGGY